MKIISKDNKIPVLMYHNIVEKPIDKYDVSLSNFIEQINYLSESEFTVESLSKYRDRVYLGNSIPKKYVILTFDDGHKSNVLAADYLNNFNFTATFFITKSYKKLKNNRLKEIEIKLLSNIHEIGSHTISHPLLTKLSNEKIKEEVIDSKKWLENCIDKEVISFSAPNGSINDNILNIIKKANYKIVCNSREWWNDISKVNDNLCSLNRVPILSYTNLTTFKKVINKNTTYYFSRLTRYYLLKLVKNIIPINLIHHIREKISK